MGAYLKLEGIPELTEALKKALVKHDEKKVRKALTRAGAPIVADAKSRAPMSDKEHTFTTRAGEKIVVKPGNLKRSIMVLPRWGRDPLGVWVGPKVARRNAGKASVNGYYAHFVEYGVKRHNLGFKGKYVSGKGGEHPGFSERPYMRPAHDNQRGQALQIMLNELAKLIENG